MLVPPLLIVVELELENAPLYSTPPQKLRKVKMGKILMTFYKEANILGGKKAVYELSAMVGISIEDAASITDTPPMLSKFNRALKNLRKQYLELETG